jgi:hypothetical protein
MANERLQDAAARYLTEPSCAATAGRIKGRPVRVRIERVIEFQPGS